MSADEHKSSALASGCSATVDHDRKVPDVEVLMQYGYAVRRQK